MYLTYWNLNRHPFSNMPDSEMYFTTKPHSDPVKEILLAITEDNERLVVLTGAEGTGRTTCLRRIVDSIDPHAHSIAFITNPAAAFTPLLREIVGQLEHRVCPNQTLGHYVQAFHKAVESTSRAHRRTLVFVDDYAAISIPDLAALHSLLTEEYAGNSPLTFIIAGSTALGSRLEEPGCRDLFQSIGAYCKTGAIEDREAMQRYIEHRLLQAGRSGPSPFDSSAIESLWSCPANRLPKNLNSVCRLCLKKSAEESLESIDSTLVSAVCADLNTNPLEKLPPRQSPQPFKADTQQSSHPACIHAATSPNSQMSSVDEAKARLAGQLAAERIRHADKILDPFDAWNSAREEILTTLQTTHLRGAVS